MQNLKVVIIVSVGVGNQECCIMGEKASKNLAIHETNLRLLMPMAKGYICMIRANLSLSPLPDPYPQKWPTETHLICSHTQTRTART